MAGEARISRHGVSLGVLLFIPGQYDAVLASKVGGREENTRNAWELDTAERKRNSGSIIVCGPHVRILPTRSQLICSLRHIPPASVCAHCALTPIPSLPYATPPVLAHILLPVHTESCRAVLYLSCPFTTHPVRPISQGFPRTNTPSEKNRGLLLR